MSKARDTSIETRPDGVAYCECRHCGRTVPGETACPECGRVHVDDRRCPACGSSEIARYVIR